MKLPRALRVARAGMDYRAASQPSGIYVCGPANMPIDLPDSLRGHRSINDATVASTINDIAAAAANSARRRG